MDEEELKTFEEILREMGLEEKMDCGSLDPLFICPKQEVKKHLDKIEMVGTHKVIKIKGKHYDLEDWIKMFFGVETEDEE